ncbi:MAG: MFS transporter [Candidatus Thermoplasmatota archaeon]|nr:MFS transporter [Candidatus Thermoplasmatota archaeon]
MARLPFFFYRYLSSRFLGSIVFNAFTVFFLWEIVVAFKSVFLAGLIPTISLASDLLLTVPVGHLIDRFNSTKLGTLSSLILILGTALLVIGQSIPFIYTATVFLTIGVMMKGDTISATIKKNLDREQFLPANQTFSGAGYASSLIGTLFGGASIIYLQHYFVLIILGMSIAALLLSFPISEPRNAEEKAAVRSELTSTFVFLKKITGFLVVGFVLNGLLVCLDVYSSGLFHLVLKVSPVYYTLFVALLSVGGIIGSLLSGPLQKHVNTAYRISLLILLYSPAILFIALVKSAIGDIVDSFLIGLLLPVINIPLDVNLMKVVPRNIYGKVMAFLRVFLGGATPALAAVFSFMALFFSVTSIFLYAGIILFPVCVLSFKVLPKFFRMANEASLNSEKEA